MSNTSVGTVLQDTYRLERLIGEGGAGTVYEASHLRLVRRFAVKVLSAKVADHPEAMERFRREALITSALGHRNILEVTDFNQTPRGELFMVMELLEGEDLAARLRREGPLALEAALAIVEQIASAMHAAHEASVVHRDLKPHNIFLCRKEGREDYVKVVDFGISKVLTSTAGLTGDTSMLGTPFYMSPEQAEQRAGTADHRADIYALGVILYEALTNTPPFDGDSMHAILYKVVNSSPAPVRGMRPEIPEAIDQAISRAMAKDPDERFASMADFWAALAACPPEAQGTGQTLPLGALAPGPGRAPDPGPTLAPDPGPTLAPDPMSATTLSSGAGEVTHPHGGSKGRRTIFFTAAATALAAVSALLYVLVLGPGARTTTPAAWRGAGAPPASATASVSDGSPGALDASLDVTTVARPAPAPAPDAGPAADGSTAVARPGAATKASKASTRSRTARAAARRRARMARTRAARRKARDARRKARGAPPAGTKKKNPAGSPTYRKGYVADPDLDE